MRIFPIIPIWIMTIVCLILLFICTKGKRKIIQILMIILIFIINLRIMIPSNNSKVLANNLDVLFVIDNTISMNAEDYGSNNKERLYAVKKDCNYIIRRLSGARFSLITFDNNARIVTPYTKDINITMESIDVMEPINELYAKGSSLNTPIDTIITSLKMSEKKTNRKRIIFFISDGEITDDSSLKSFSSISQYIDNGAVLGYGTTKGGYMKNKSPYSESDDYIMDYSDSNYDYGKAVSKLDEKNLKKIANDIGINYINMSKQSNINNKLKEIENLVNASFESDDKSTYDDTYYILVIPLLILLIVEFNQLWRKKI